MNKFEGLEVLAPAGDSERFYTAVNYGADAVYLGAKSFTMRASPDNFTFEELKKAAEFAHERGVRVYLTCNTLPRNNEIPLFEEFIKNAELCGVDAVIVADLGLLSLIKRYTPGMEVHMSTQTGIVNYAAANALYDLGVKRAVLARELSLDEIADIRAKIPRDMEIEVFVHGAMCVSFSGRCLLSAYLTGRDANRGACAQPCRWKYHLFEENREGQFFPIEEDDNGTYILNSKDMCMIEHIDKLADAGVTSLKIEGRAKSAYYVAVTANAYRMAVDWHREHGAQPLPRWIADEVYKVSHRKYCTGFFFGQPEQYTESGGYIRSYDVVAVVERCENGIVYATQRNRFFANDELEVFSPKTEPVVIKPSEIFDENGELLETVNHAMMKFSFKCDRIFPSGAIIRKALEQ